MKKILIGQGLMILCCAFYIAWWYRCYKPGVNVNRIGGVNGVLLLITAALGIAGVTLSLQQVPLQEQHVIPAELIWIGAAVAYFVLLFITRFIFDRIVTTELVLITAWTAVEVLVCSRLYAASGITRGNFIAACIVIAAAFIISMVLYVAYYRMEENRAFYAAMVPLVTEACAMAAVLIMGIS